MVDFEAFRNWVEFTVKHHGTKTEGEDYRYKQVASVIAHTVERLIDANTAIENGVNAQREYPIIKLTVG